MDEKDHSCTRLELFYYAKLGCEERSWGVKNESWDAIYRMRRAKLGCEERSEDASLGGEERS